MKIKIIHKKSRETYGTPRVYDVLREPCRRIGLNRVARLMRANGIMACYKRRFITTTDSSHQYLAASNILKRNFDVKEPDRVWASDITYIRTYQGFMYLALITDAYSRKIVGYDISNSLELKVCIKALKKALNQLPGNHQLIHHSDRGIQYCSKAYTQLLSQKSIQISMAGKGNCYENAMAERINGILKDELPEDFYSTKNYTDYILNWLERDKNDQNPFFAYVSYTAPHDPLHAPKEYIDKYKGKYDNGFNELRTARFESLKSLGIIPDSSTIFPWTGPTWDDLSEEEKKESARDMEVYAAMIEYMDDQMSRIFNWLKENNKMDNTIIVFFSDNGANGAMGTAYPGQTEAYLNSFDNSLENRGLPNSFIEMGPAWATASMSPHRLFKAFTTEGGIISPCIVKLPESMNNNIKMKKAFTHISDMMPTFLESAGIIHPSEKNDSIPKMMGKSLLPLLTGEKEVVHYNEGIGYELHGMRAYIKNEWKIINLPVPFGSGDWQLYNLAEDPAESLDLSEQFPEIRNELIYAWE